MTVNLICENEKKRVETLKNYEVLDTEREEELDIITRIASAIFNVPICLISLVDDKRQWFKSKVGLGANETPKEISFCQYAIQQEEAFIVEDSLKDERFVNNPLVTGDPHIRFYAGMPLCAPNGCKIGTLCVIDIQSRSLTDQQKETLKALSKYIIKHLELKKKNKELIRLNELTQKLYDSKEEFFNNMSHEIRTPLNAIYGFSQLLLTTRLNDDQREMTSTINSSCEVLVTLVNDILDLAKLDSDKVKLEVLPFNIKDTLKDIYNLLKVKVKNPKVAFNLQVDPSIPDFVMGDKIRLHQILINLTGNALKFTSEGHVNIKVESNLSAEDSLNNKVSLRFSVRDTGIGIPSDRVESVFNRFEQASTDINRKFGGTGLGLNISRKLVELQGGQLRVISEMNKGSEFYFSILYDLTKPEDIAKIQSKPSNESGNTKSFGLKKILVFEDNECNYKLLTKVLQNTGLKLKRAENGQIGLKILKEENFDLIIMDLFMPVMGGFDATRVIRNEMNIEVPIIAMTANNSKSEKDMCLEIGMNDYLTKPFKAQELIQLLSRYLNRNSTCNKSSNNPFKKILPNRGLIKKIKIVNITNESYGNNSINTKDISVISLKRQDRKKGVTKLLKSSPNGSPSIYHNNSSIVSKTNHNNQEKLPIISSIFKNIKTNNNVNNNKLRQNLHRIYKTDKFVYKERINFEVFRQYFGDDEDDLKEMIKTFINENQILMEKLEKSIKEAKSGDIKMFAHTCKSQVAMFGLGLMRSQFQEIENLCERPYEAKLIFDEVKERIKFNYIQLEDYCICKKE